MKLVNMHDAKTHLSRLVAAAAKGESFIIAKAGKPLVKVVAVDGAEESPDEAKARAARRIGFMEGAFTVPDDFDTFMQDEIIAMFEGKYKGVLLDPTLGEEPRPFVPPSREP